MDRFKSTNSIPFVVAIQALALFVVAFFQTPQLESDAQSVGAFGQYEPAPETLTSLSELPRDLQREKLPIPRFPEREKRNEPPVATPTEDSSETTPGGEGSKLAALRVANVAMTGPVAIAIAAPMLGVPDSLDGLSLAGGNWLGGRPRGSRGTGRAGGPSDGGGGLGGRGIGGYGGGSGGYCPTPGRIGGGGADAQLVAVVSAAVAADRPVAVAARRQALRAAAHVDGPQARAAAPVGAAAPRANPAAVRSPPSLATHHESNNGSMISLQKVSFRQG